MPASAVDADRQLPGERPVRDLAVEGGTGKSGAQQHRLEADDFFRVGHGALLLHAMVVDGAPWVESWRFFGTAQECRKWCRRALSSAGVPCRLLSCDSVANIFSHCVPARALWVLPSASGSV